MLGNGAPLRFPFWIQPSFRIRSTSHQSGCWAGVSRTTQPTASCQMSRCLAQKGLGYSFAGFHGRVCFFAQRAAPRGGKCMAQKHPKAEFKAVGETREVGGFVRSPAKPNIFIPYCTYLVRGTPTKISRLFERP